MYVSKTIHSRYIGMSLKHQIPMYPKKEYIGTPQKLAIPMYLPQVYQIKQPALPLTSNLRRISAQIIVRLTRAGICCEGKQVYSWEINMNTSGLCENLEFRCVFQKPYIPDTSGFSNNIKRAADLFPDQLLLTLFFFQFTTITYNT